MRFKELVAYEASSPETEIGYILAKSESQDPFLGS